MFYSQFILAKKGPLGTIWIAAHLERKLKKNQVAETDITDSVDSILFPDVPIALRLSSHLLLGVVRIYSKKVNYLFHDCSETLLKVKQAFRSTAVDLPPEESTAPYHSITLPETFDLDDFELPDTVGNFDDRNVSTKEQITLQDALDGAGFSDLQFGLDERFGDGDASQIGLDFDEEFLRDSNLVFQQVKEGVFQHGEGSSDIIKVNDNEEQAIRDKENNDAYSNDLSKLLGGDRGKNVITNIQSVNKSDEFSHRLMFNIRTPDLNEVFMPDNECIGGPSGTHDIDMDPTSPVFNEHNNLPITPMVEEVAMVQEAACADAANDNIPNAMSTNPELDSVVLDKPNSTLNDSPITPMVQEVKCANAANDNILNATLMNQESNIVLLNEPNSTLNDSPITPMVQEVKCANAANDDILNATLMNQESNTVLLNEPNSTLNELSTMHIVQEVQCADAANDNILNATSTKPESDNVVLNEPNDTANDSKNAEDTSIPIPITVADPKLADGHVGSAVANPGLVEKETYPAAATALPNGVCSEESSHVVSSVNDISTLNHAQIGDANSVQTNHISFLNSDFHLKSCTSVSSQANSVSPDELCCSVAPTVDKDIQYREFTTSMQGPCSDIAIDRNAEAQPNLNDVQPQQLNHLPSSEAPEPERLLFTPTVNFTSSNDQNMQFSQGSPSNMAINTNTVAQLKLSDVQVDQLNYLQSSEAPQPERLSPAVNFTLSNDQNMHFSPGPPSNIAAINTNTVAQPKLNDVQLDQLNPLPSPEAPENERLSFTPAVNFIPSSDQNVHFSQGPSNIAINTNSEARSTSNNVQLDRLNHLPSPEVPAPERLSFTPAVNFNPSNNQNMHFSQGPSNISINTNAEAQTTLNNVQLDQLNHLPSSEAPVPERLSFTPAVNFTPSNDQNMHFSQGPSSIAINTNSEAQPKLNNVQLDQLNHLPRSEAPAPERLLFTPAGNFTPSNDQHMPFSQGMHFTQGMPFSQGMQFSQDMHFRGPSTSIQGYPSDNATVRNRETLAQPKSNEHINQLNYLSNSQFSEPERMLFAPSVNYFASNDKEKQPVNKGVIELDGSVDRTGTLSGKKRPLIDNTPYIQNDTSFNGSSILQKRQHNDYIIPQDDDLLASILVGRTPALKVGPSPPIPKPPTSKRPRLTQKTGLPKRRKVLLDDPIVLHADTIRQQLINTDDIHRLRKKVPCTIPEIWRLQRNLLEEGEEEKDIFGGSLFTGISQELISLNTRKYASAKRLPEQGVSHDSTIKAIKEFGGNKSPVSVMDNNGPETVTPSIDLLERVNVPEIVSSNVEASERVNVSEIVTPNVEMSESVNVSEIVIPNMEMPESVNVSEIVAPNMEVSERVEVSEIVTPNVEVSERVEVSEIVAPNVEVSERVEVSEIVAPNVEVSERVEVSEIVAPNVEVLERVEVSEMVTPNVEVSERVNMSEMVTPNVERSETVNVSEIVTPNVEGLERVNVSEIVTPVVEVPERVEIPELIGTKNCNNLLSIETHEPHDVDLPESNTSNTEFGDTVMEEKCDEVNNDLLLGAPDMPVSVNDDMPHRADLSNDKVTEVTVEDMAVDVVNMAEVGSEFKEYASYIVGEANSLDPDPHVTEGEHAASAMDKNLSVNAEAGLDVGNNHIEHEPTKESNENLPVNVETGLSVDSNHTEHSAIKEPDVNLSGNVETAPDVDTNDIEHAATKESDDFDDDMDNIDTDFLNVDDDVEYEEDTTTDVQNAEDAQSLETVGWSARTRGVANYLKIMFDQESGRGRKSVAIDQLLAGKTRKEASRMFFETLVLKTRDYIQVEQEKPYAYINVQPRMKLLKSEF